MRDKPEQDGSLTLLVGAGRMGGALLKSWLSRGLAPIAVTEPAPSAELRILARRRAISLFPSIADAGRLRPSCCVVALKPQILLREGSELRPFARRGTLMLSIAAGTSTAALRRAWGREAVTVRAMPNTPGAIGRGISVLYASRGTARSYRRRSEALLSGLGEMFWVGRESLIDTVTAVSGSGPAYVFLLAECLAKAAREQGFSAAIADRLARATVAGAGALLDADDRDAASLRRDVTSPGGTTEAALEVLTSNEALQRLMIRAVAAARARSVQLRRQSET